MTRIDPDRIQLRNPDSSKRATQVAGDTYALARRTVLEVVPAEEPGITLEAYLAEMKSRLPNVSGWDASLSSGWYAMAMKLDLEARGELKRINRTPPQRLVRS